MDTRGIQNDINPKNYRQKGASNVLNNLLRQTGDLKGYPSKNGRRAPNDVDPRTRQMETGIK